MKNFIYGFTYPLRCLKLFSSNPKLIGYSIAPMIINMLIYGSIFIFSYIRMMDFIGSLTGAGDSDAGFLSLLLGIVLLVFGLLLLLTVCYLLFTILGGIVSAPFNEKISKKVELLATCRKDYPELGFWQDARLSIGGELKKLAFYFAFLSLFFLLNFVPVVGSIISASAAIVFSFFFNALDFLDYPMTRRVMSFRLKLSVTRSGSWLTYGFGCMAFFMLFLPVVNVFMKPVLVAAGTNLYFERGYDISAQNLLEKK